MVLRREREAWTEVQAFAQQRRAMYEPGIRDTENWQVWGVCVCGGAGYGFRSLQRGQISWKPFRSQEHHYVETATDMIKMSCGRK